MDKLDTLGARLRWARKNAQMTQAAASRAVGLSQPTLSDLENDNTKGTSSIVELASLYGISAQWLKSGRGSPQAQRGNDVNSTISGNNPVLSIESIREERAKLLAEKLLYVSEEMRALIEKLLDADQEGGAMREMTIAGTGYVLQAIPLSQAQKKAKK
jgi:transcriptional regulator with XRE-family HTH domain